MRDPFKLLDPSHGFYRRQTSCYTSALLDLHNIGWLDRSFCRSRAYQVFGEDRLRKTFPSLCQEFVMPIERFVRRYAVTQLPGCVEIIDRTVITWFMCTCKCGDYVRKLGQCTRQTCCNSYVFRFPLLGFM